MPSGWGKRGTRASGPSRSAARASSAANACASSTGFVKNEPAETESGSAGSMTMPFPRRSAEHGAAHVGERGRLPLGDPERAGELGVADRGRVIGLRERVGDREHDPAAGRALEHARAVREAAVGGGELLDRAGVAVIDAHGDDRVRDLLPVGADVLDRGGADRAGDAGQALDAGAARPPRSRPRTGPTARRRRPTSAVAVGVHAAGGDPEHGAGEAGVGDDQVRAAGQDQQRLALRVGGADRGDHRVLVLRHDEPAGRAAEAQRREIGQQRHPGQGTGPPRGSRPDPPEGW